MVNVTISTEGIQGSPGVAGSSGSGTSSSSSTILLFDDFISNTAVGNTGFTSTSVSGGSSSIVASESNHSGIVQLSTGSSSSSAYSNLFLGSNTIFLGNGNLDLEFLIRIPTLSAGPEEYTVRVGLGDTLNGDHSNGIWFEYDRTTSVNWRYCVNNEGSATKNTSTTPVLENTWIKLKISINADASLITFYINGVSIGTVASGFSINGFGPRIHIVKSNGTGARVLQMDYFSMSYNLVVSR